MVSVNMVGMRLRLGVGLGLAIGTNCKIQIQKVNFHSFFFVSRKKSQGKLYGE